jgi:phage baseplate assembly protein W
MDWSTSVTVVLPTAISFPYSVDPTGRVASTTSTAKIYLDRVLTLLSVNIGQRPMLPSYGVDWSKALFESDGDSQAAISLAIQEAISTWIPEVGVISISITSDVTSGTENITITLRLPDNTVSNLAVNSSTLNYDGTITR